ncbi:hypothetical protein K435DRAFT_973464, partial [Dendrothele bispora CBS 962.96]
MSLARDSATSVACRSSGMLECCPETLIRGGIKVPIITFFPLLFPSTTTRTTTRRHIVLRLPKTSPWFALSSWCCLFKPLELFFFLTCSDTYTNPTPTVPSITFYMPSPFSETIFGTLYTQAGIGTVLPIATDRPVEADYT